MNDFAAMGARANFALLCVQVDFEKALSGFIWIGDWKQAVQYEGFKSICFECGKIGHKKERCPSVLCATAVNHNTVDESMVDGNQKSPQLYEEKNHRKEENEDGRGPWMLVARKKGRTPMRNTAVEGKRGQIPVNEGRKTETSPKLC